MTAAGVALGAGVAFFASALLSVLLARSRSSFWPRDVPNARSLHAQPTPRTGGVAILLGVAAEVPAAGSRRVRSQSRNGTSVTMADYQGAFTLEDRSTLRALCGAASAAAVGAPVGSFPPSTITKCIWPPERP